eukprot:scaffold229957_cov18-Tisochrysis_lutea.AAC.2
MELHVFRSLCAALCCRRIITCPPSLRRPFTSPTSSLLPSSSLRWLASEWEKSGKSKVPIVLFQRLERSTFSRHH